MARDKKAHAAYMREWYAANPDKAKANAKASYRRNKAKRNAESRRWYEQNKERSAESSAARYERNKLDPEWRKERAEYLKRYRRANREKVLANQRRYRERTADKQREYSLRSRRKHGDKILAANKEWRRQNPDYHAERYKSDDQYRLARILSSRFRGALRGNHKSGRAVELLGCTIEEFKRHIEAQWQPGMTWGNHRRYGWHIDHIRPLNSFDLSDPEQQAMACHYTNLQPLWWRENISKRDRWDKEAV